VLAGLQRLANVPWPHVDRVDDTPLIPVHHDRQADDAHRRREHCRELGRPARHATVEQALNLPYGDFEDAVQMMAAVQAGAQHLVTRDVQDYKIGPLPALQPAELLALL
jgi:hypothetical protein